MKKGNSHKKIIVPGTEILQTGIGIGSGRPIAMMRINGRTYVAYQD